MYLPNFTEIGKTFRVRTMSVKTYVQNDGRKDFETSFITSTQRSRPKEYWTYLQLENRRRFLTSYTTLL